MGITDFFSDIMSSLPWPQEAHAESPADDKDEEGEESSKDEGENKEEGGDSEKGEEGGEDAEEGGDDGEAEEEEEEEEEEEDDEPVDPKPKLEADCARSSQCIGYKHHYEECVERVTAMNEDEDYKGPKEDCVEEFFHLQHCVTQCAAPRLFKMLK